MIINESTMKQFHIYQDNWEEHGKTIAFSYQRNDGVRMPDKIYIPKSLISKESKSGKITTFKIPEWILKQKLRPGYNLIEW